MADPGLLDALRAALGDAGLAALALTLTALAAIGFARSRRKATPAAPPQQPPRIEAPAQRLELPPAREPALARRPEAEPAVVPAPAPSAPPAQPAPAPRASLRERLARTQSALIGRALQLIGARTLDAQLEGELETLLFSADLGVKTAESLLARVQREAAGGDAAQVRAALRERDRSRSCARWKRAASRSRRPPSRT